VTPPTLRRDYQQLRLAYRQFNPMPLTHKTWRFFVDIYPLCLPISPAVKQLKRDEQWTLDLEKKKKDE